MEKNRKTSYSMAKRAGLIVGLFLLFIISIFGLERYQLEKARVFLKHRQEIERVFNKASYCLVELTKTLEKIESNTDFSYQEKVNWARETVQPIISQAQSGEKTRIYAFYSPSLKTFVAISPENKYNFLIGNNFFLPSERKKAERIIKNKIDGYPLFTKPLVCSQGTLRGQIWALIPSDRFQTKLFSRLRKPLNIILIATGLSIAFSFYLSRQIKKTTFLFQDNLKSFTTNPGSHRVEKSSIPSEFIPLFQQYSHMVNRIQNLLEELSISARTAVLGNLIGVIAHDVRNPLSIIKNSAQFGLQAECQEKKQKNLERIIKSSDEINQLLERSLSLVRVPGDETEIICLANLIEEIKEMAALLLVKKNIRFQFQIPSGLPQIRGNSLALRQALMNIIQNSIDAIQSRGKIIVEAKTTEDKGILLSITDNGEGIPPEIKDKVFTRFFTTKGEKGTGLGLALAQRVIKKHGGNIWALSEPEKGTTINIYFPPIS